MLEICQNYYVSKTRKVNGGFMPTGDLTFNEDMEIAIKNSRVYNGIKNVLSDKKEGNIITTEILFVWGILFSNNSLITELNDRYHHRGLNYVSPRFIY